MSKEVFVRKATGLSKPFGPFDSFVLIVGGINLGSGTLLVYSTSLAFAPGYNYILSLLIAVVLVLFAVITYSMITMVMPRSGGEYVFVSRTASPALGFANSFFWFVVSILGIAWNALFMAGTGVSASLAVGGAALNSQYLSSLAQVATQPFWAFMIGLVAMLFTAVLMVFSAKWLKIVNTTALAIGMIMVLAWVVVLASTPRSSFMSAFNTFAQPYTGNPNSYQMMIDTAKNSGMTIAVDWNAVLSATIITLPISYFTVLGGNILNFFSGEIKEVNRTAVWVVLGATFTVAAFDILIGVALFNSAGYEFMTSLSYLAFNAPASYGLPTSPFLPLIVEIASPNMVMVSLTLVGMICWMYLLLAPYYLMATRNMFAWSFDGVIPTWFSETHKTYHTPVRAVITITIIAALGIAFYDYFSLAFSFTNFTAAYNSGLIVGCACAAIFPFAKRELFEAQSTFVKRRLAGIPVMTILGILGTLGVIAMDVMVAQNPGYAGIRPELSYISLAILGLIFLIGLIVFFAAKAIQKSRGLDLSLVFKEIPPS